MSCDYVVHYVCQPKLDFGKSDPTAGTEELLEMVKARNRAAMVEDLARQHGTPPEQQSITLNLLTPEGASEEREVSYNQLLLEAAPLDAVAPHCIGCPANFLGEVMGCCGAVNYPIAGEIEEWIANHVEPAENFGGQLCIQFMTEFQVDGSHSQGMRNAGYFVDKRPRQAVLAKGFLKKITISTNQVFDAILGAGNPLQASHCWGILLWLGALRIDGKKLGPVDDRGPLDSLLSCESREQKLEHVSLEVGDRNPEHVICQIQDLLDAMYRCWIEDVPMLISP